MWAVPFKSNKSSPALTRGEMASEGMRGKFYAGFGCGVMRAGTGRAGKRHPLSGIYQHRQLFRNPNTPNKRRYGIVPYIIMKPYRPTNPRTELQQEGRNKFRDAMTAWAALTDDQKLPYIKAAKRKQCWPHNVFVSEYMSTH